MVVENWLSLLSFGPDGWGDELAAGAWLTIRLALTTLPFGLALGFLVALAKNSHNRILLASSATSSRRSSAACPSS
jgi:polar amino acid transport system permease protein